MIQQTHHERYHFMMGQLYLKNKRRIQDDFVQSGKMYISFRRLTLSKPKTHSCCHFLSVFLFAFMA